jgi:uncharacterized protein YndB with AHSA1/START domain
MMPTTATESRNIVTTPAPDEIRIIRWFNAPRQLVFNAWTDPAMLVRWFGCAAFTTMDAQADARAGGAWRVVMRSPEGQDFPAYGEYIEVVSPERIVMTHRWEKQVAGVNPAHHRTLVTVNFFDEGTGTRLEFRQTGLATIASRDSHIGGWSDSMDALYRLALEGRLPAER